MNSSKKNKEIYVGNQPHQYKKKEIKGTEISVDGQTYYKISNADQMRPFFMIPVAFLKIVHEINPCGVIFKI